MLTSLVNYHLPDSDDPRLSHCETSGAVTFPPPNNATLQINQLECNGMLSNL